MDFPRYALSTHCDYILFEKIIVDDLMYSISIAFQKKKKAMGRCPSRIVKQNPALRTQEYVYGHAPA